MSERVILLIGVMAVFPNCAVAEEETVTPIPAAEAGQHIGKEATVELKVASSRMIGDRNMCLLNSEKNFRDEKNFTVVLRRAGLKAFKETKQIENPAEHFADKTVRVKGKIVLYRNKPQIIVEKPEQIEIVEDKKFEKTEQKSE